eukprot:7377776-Prymnesium_polylepis.3
MSRSTSVQNMSSLQNMQPFVQRTSQADGDDAPSVRGRISRYLSSTGRSNRSLASSARSSRFPGTSCRQEADSRKSCALRLRASVFQGTTGRSEGGAGDDVGAA